MPDLLVRLMLLFFAVFLVCGWIVIVLDSSFMGTRHRVPALIGMPIFAALCCFVAFVPVSGGSGRAALAPQDVFLVLFTLLAFLCALGSIIAVPLALRARQQQSQHGRHHHHHHHHHHDDVGPGQGGKTGHAHTAVRATWIPRQPPPREE